MQKRVAASVAASTAKKLKFEQKMTHGYYLRKFAFLTQHTTKKVDPKRLHYEELNLIRNFQLFFPHYSTNHYLVNSMISWTVNDSKANFRLMKLFENYVLQNQVKYTPKELVHVINTLSKERKSDELLSLMDKSVMEEMSQLDTQDVAMAVRLTKSEALLRKVKDENRLVARNELDLVFFLSAYLRKNDIFPEAVKQLESELERLLPQITKVQSLCKVFEVYAKTGVPFPSHLVKGVETAICNKEVQLTALDVNRLLTVLSTQHYYKVFSNDFWLLFEEKICARENLLQPCLLLTILAQHYFTSASLMERVLPLWMAEVEKTQDKGIFRKGLCALTKFPDVTSKCRDWCVMQAIYFRQHFSTYDIAFILHSLPGPEWYNPTLWKALLDCFFSLAIDPPNDIDLSMVYFAIKSLEIDGVKMPIINSIVSEKEAILRAAFLKFKSPTTVSKPHSQVATVLKTLQLRFEEFKSVAEIYTPDFVLPEDRIAIYCQDWPHHLSVYQQRISVGVQMMLRHLNLQKWRVIIVASYHDLDSRLPVLVEQLQKTKEIVNKQLV